MTTIYMLLEVAVLLAVIVIPLKGPKTKRVKGFKPLEMSDIAVNEEGFLVSLKKSREDNYPMV